jgi:hypothetical protein
MRKQRRRWLLRREQDSAPSCPLGEDAQKAVDAAPFVDDVIRAMAMVTRLAGGRVPEQRDGKLGNLDHLEANRQHIAFLAVRIVARRAMHGSDPLLGKISA